MDIYKVIDKLKLKRKLFVSEADMQLELAWIIKEEYPNAKVRLEYSPEFETNMHIDILVMMENKLIPIELKYKTKACIKKVDDEIISLKSHGAKDINCYLYLKDILRIERIKKNMKNYDIGYTIFITNDLSYTKPPMKSNSYYKEFSLENNTIKKGILDWDINTGSGTKRKCEIPIELEGIYPIKWQDYSNIDTSNTGTFKILINEVR